MKLQQCLWESSGPARPWSCTLPTVTHLQSVSLPSVCSHLISAHTLCLSLSSLRWWDAVCMGHTHAHLQTHTHRESDVWCDFLIQHVSLKEGTREHDSNAAVSLSTSCKTQEQRVAGINTPYLHPKPCWGLALNTHIHVCLKPASIPARLHSGVLWPRRSYLKRMKRRQTRKTDNTTRLKESV